MVLFDVLGCSLKSGFYTLSAAMDDIALAPTYRKLNKQNKVEEKKEETKKEVKQEKKPEEKKKVEVPVKETVTPVEKVLAVPAQVTVNVKKEPEKPVEVKDIHKDGVDISKEIGNYINNNFDKFMTDVKSGDLQSFVDFISNTLDHTQQEKPEVVVEAEVVEEPVEAEVVYDPEEYRKTKSILQAFFNMDQEQRDTRILDALLANKNDIVQSFIKEELVNEPVMITMFENILGFKATNIKFVDYVMEKEFPEQTRQLEECLDKYVRSMIQEFVVPNTDVVKESLDPDKVKINIPIRFEAEEDNDSIPTGFVLVDDQDETVATVEAKAVEEPAPVVEETKNTQVNNNRKRNNRKK